MYISLLVDYHVQLSSSPSAPPDETKQQHHHDYDGNSNADPEVKSKSVIDIERESQNIELPQEELQLEMLESKERVLPCSSPVGSATGTHVCVHYAIWELLLIVNELAMYV